MHMLPTSRNGSRPLNGSVAFSHYLETPLPAEPDSTADTVD